VPLGESGGEPYGFTGEQWDASAGLVYLRARYYQPGVGRFISKDQWGGREQTPQTLNGFVYVTNNPINQVDPSGYIALAEAEDALRIIKQLRRDYGVAIVVDFGWSPVPIMHPAPGERPACAKWEEGAWKNVDELEAVLEVARRYEDKAGSAGAAQRAIGGVTVERISQGTTQHLLGRITIADYTFNQSGGSLKRKWGPKVAIAHELAHYWDWKTGSAWAKTAGGSGAIVAGMPSAIQGEVGPTWYARTSIVEGWAESVAGYLFSEYFAFLVQEAKLTGDPREYRVITLPSGNIVRLPPGLGPRHRAYVVAQFRALSASTP
jgi:RHS repeat-associated protein